MCSVTKYMVERTNECRGVIQQVLDWILPTRISRRISRWADFKCKRDTSELCGEKILHYQYRWIRPQEIRIADIKTWQIIMNMGFDVVLLCKDDGTELPWVDKHNDLIEILRTKVPALELPGTYQ